MPKILNIVGQRFGRLVVLEKSDKKDKKGNIKWQCRCDCGTVKLVVGSNLMTDHTTSCGCYYREVLQNNIKKTAAARTKSFGIASRNRLFDHYRRASKLRGYSFELSVELFTELTQGSCFYCGVLPYQIMSYKYYNGQYIYNGIDRLNNSLGYIVGNVVPCCGICNKAKGSRNREDFEAWVHLVHDRLVEKLGK